MNSTKNRIDGWRYYNHAAIPSIPEYKNPDLSPIEDGRIWSIDNKKPLLVRWTTDFDSDVETNFWYVIKDKPFDIDSLSSHYRNQIKKGVKNFEVKEIDQFKYGKELIEIQQSAFSVYSNHIHTKIEEKPFSCGKYFGSFYKETGQLCGYIITFENEKEINFNSMRTIPKYEKQGISEALIYGMLCYYSNDLLNGKYITDGARNINHKTNFQNYLEKKFGFRKAYCKLHVKYHHVMYIAVKLLYPFRKIIKNQRISGILTMEEIVRKEAKNEK